MTKKNANEFDYDTANKKLSLIGKILICLCLLATLRSSCRTEKTVATLGSYMTLLQNVAERTDPEISQEESAIDFSNPQ